MSTERVLTVLGNQATRPITDFALLARGTGDVYYVSSDTGDDGRAGKSPETAVATLDYAIGLCTANQGDIIYVLPGHTETVSEASGVDVDVAGISIIGIGEGADRPTFTFSAVDATMTVDAASCVVKNLLVKPSIDSVVSPIVVSAANCTIDVEIQDATALIECVSGILTTAAADNLDINLKYRGFIAGDACLTPIKLVGVDTARIYVDFYGVADTAVVEFSGTNCHDIDIEGKFYNNGTSLTKNVVDSAGGSTWSVRGWDGNSNANFSGGDNSALASDDASAIAAAVATAQADLDILTGATGANLLTATQASIDAIEADTAYIADGALPADPTASSLATFIASGGTALGQPLPASTSIVDIVGDFTGPHGGAAQDDNIKASLDLAHTDLDAIIEDITSAVDEPPTAKSLHDILHKDGSYTFDNTTDSLEAIADAVATVDGLHDVPTVNGTADATVRDVVGRKTDAAVGAVGTENSLVGYIKGILTDTIGLVAGQAKGQWVTKSQVVSSGIPNAAQTAAIATLSGGGAWLSDIIIQTNATGLAGPTTVQFTINNANGAYVDATDIVVAEVVASLGANVTLLKAALDTDALPVFVESGKSVYIQGDDGVGTGAGIADIILKWEAAELGATVAASNVAGT